MNELQKTFTEEHLALLKDFADAEKRIKQEEKARDAFKEQIKRAMEEYGIKSLDCDLLKIAYVESSESTTIDTTKIRNKDEELYLELLASYPKVTKRKAYIRLMVK